MVHTHGGAAELTMWPDSHGAGWIPANNAHPKWNKIFGEGPPGGDPPDGPWKGCLAKLNHIGTCRICTYIYIGERAIMHMFLIHIYNVCIYDNCNLNDHVRYSN